MRHFGLIGKSLSHSFSAKFFNGKFKAEEIDADYQLFEIDNIAEIDDIIAKHNLEGLNVTIPYKESIIPHLDGLTKEAHEIGAVNCVVIRNGQKIGHNTDLMGIEASLHWLDLDAEPKPKALLLGSGGHQRLCSTPLNAETLSSWWYRAARSVAISPTTSLQAR